MDDYYSKYLKYKLKYLNLKNMIGGKEFALENFKDNFTYDQLLNFIGDFATNNYTIKQTNYRVLQEKKFNFCNSNFFIIGVPHITNKEEPCRYLYLGEIKMDETKFNTIWVSEPTLQLECMCLYDTKRGNSNDAQTDLWYSKNITIENIHWRYNCIIFGFISKTLINKDQLVIDAKRKRAELLRK
jgi:hypothetical protein